MLAVLMEVRLQNVISIWGTRYTHIFSLGYKISYILYTKEKSSVLSAPMRIAKHIMLSDTGR